MCVSLSFSVSLSVFLCNAHWHIHYHIVRIRYTSIVPLDEENALVMYSVETVDFGPWIFTMRFTLRKDG